MITNGHPKKGRVLIGHGAGAPMDSDFMVELAERFAAVGFEAVRYEFPYMQKRRLDGKKRPPDRLPTLIDFLTELINSQNDEVPLFLAGKSMGGRVSTMCADHARVSGCFVFGYPFHPIGKPDRLRIDHLQSLKNKVDIFQGTRDPMGTLPEVGTYNLPQNIQCHWLEDGNHDLKPRKASGFTQSDHLDSAFLHIQRLFT